MSNILFHKPSIRSGPSHFSIFSINSMISETSLSPTLVISMMPFCVRNFPLSGKYTCNLSVTESSDDPFVFENMSMAFFTATFGVRVAASSGELVKGLVAGLSSERHLPNHRSIACRSYVFPSTVITGSFIISLLMGQLKASSSVLKRLTKCLAASDSNSTVPIFYKSSCNRKIYIF